MCSNPPSLCFPHLILDTDPGGDDIFALLWLLSLVSQGKAALVAVTTTAGNVSVQRTFTSASQVLTFMGCGHIPVGRGAMNSAIIAEDAAHIHGADGMGNLSHTLPPGVHDFDAAPNSADLLIETLLANPGQLTIVAIGPLTNLAEAEAKRPGILRQAKELVVMAGAFHVPGNMSPQAEFNVFYHPEAAQTVFHSRDDVVVIPLDVTRQLVLTPAMMQSLEQVYPLGNLGKFLVALGEFMMTTTLRYRESGGMAGFLVHDAATIAYLFYPETLLFQRSHICIETQGQWTRGQTVIDRRHGAKSNANAWLATQVDVNNFFASFLEDLKHLLKSEN